MTSGDSTKAAPDPAGSDRRNRSRSKAARSGLSLLRGLRPLRWSLVPGELIAGVSLAALAIPESMGYARIAGMPVVTGLYTLLLPLVLFALFGASKHLVVGADSATAALLAGSLALLAAPGSPQYTALAGLLAALAAAFLLLARVVRLGFLADFLSRTVLIGFLTGVGIQVALGQLPGLLGIEVPGHGSLERLVTCLERLGHSIPLAAGLSAAVLLGVGLSHKFSKRIPAALLAVLASIVASRTLGWTSADLPLVGTVLGGLPQLTLPQVELSRSLFEQLVPTAFGLALVILAQSAATSRAYALRHEERFDLDSDLIGLGAANLGAALTGTFVVNGSPTKTQFVESAGGRSQLAQLTAAGLVVLLLLFLTPALAALPEAVLASLVFLVGWQLVDFKHLSAIRHQRRWEFWVALITASTVILWGVGQALLLAVLLSLIAHTRHGYRPKNLLMVEGPGGRWQPRPIDSHAQLAPGLIVYRFTHSLYYANSGLLYAELQELADSADPPLAWLCIEGSAIDDIDFSAAEVLTTLQPRLARRGIRLVFAALAEEVQQELDRSRLTPLLGPNAYFDSINDVLNAFEARDRT